MTEYFPPDYSAARERFRALVDRRGGRRWARPHDRYPELSTDVAVLGDETASSAFVLVSGTHGIEGFAGSATQACFLDTADLTGIAVVLVHALNPYGFAHRSRVDDGNVDVNRNFVDHAAPPANEGYDRLHPLLLPADWEGPDHRRCQGELMTVLGEMGPRGVQAAVTRGQYEHADGLFYGGRAPTWSHHTWRSIVRETLARYSSVTYIDIHTGLGERGATEPIFRGGHDAGALSRARDAYGADALTDSEAGTSSSTPIGGNTAVALAEGLPAECLLTAITLEFGTLPPPAVLAALQADNLHRLGRLGSERERTVAAELMSAAFDPDDEQWRRDVLSRGASVVAAGAALARHMNDTKESVAPIQDRSLKTAERA